MNKTSTRFRTFVWACLQWAFGSWKTGKNIVGLTGPVLRFAVNVIGIAAMLTGSALATWADQTSPYLFVLPLFWYLLLAGVAAPYALWKQERVRATAAELALEPKFTVSAAMRSGKDGKVGCIQVENQHAGALLNCVGLLRGIYYTQDGQRVADPEVPPMYFRWADRFQHEQGSSKLTINSVAELEVAKIAAGVSDYHIRLMSFHPEKLVAAQMRNQDVYLPERHCYVLDIEVRPENAPSVRSLFRLNVPEYPVQRGAHLPGGGFSYGPQPEWTFEKLDTE